MQFKDIIGQEEVKEQLRKRVADKRIAHTQLFLGPEGSGNLALAIAFSQYLNCENKQNGDSCGQCPSCIKYRSFAHPDLHFFFPTITSESIKAPKSELYMKEWREYLIKTGGYVTQEGWWEQIGLSGNKQGTIYVRDASDIIQTLSIKPYEAEFKTVIIYLPEKLHLSASNKLLKTFEEPPQKSLILMAGERYELLLPTVRSRTQLVKIPRLRDEDIKDALVQYDGGKTDAATLENIVMQSYGNWNKALTLLENIEDEQFNFIKFREWMRLCFNPGNFVELINLSKKLASLPREKQKRLLLYGMEVIHNTLLSNTRLTGKIRTAGEEAEYIRKFSPFINEVNREKMYELLNRAVYHLERNANANILFGDLSIQFSILLAQGRQKVKQSS